MTTRPVEPAKRTFKHIQATNIWAFVHGIGELNDEEHKHLKQCQHCVAIFEYFKVYDHRGKDLQDPVETDPVGTLG
jgi:hypothetical protein